MLPHAGFGIPSLACKPDVYDDLMDAAIQKRDVSAWAAEGWIATASGRDPTPSRGRGCSCTAKYL